MHRQTLASDGAIQLAPPPGLALLAASLHSSRIFPSPPDQQISSAAPSIIPPPRMKQAQRVHTCHNRRLAGTKLRPKSDQQRRSTTYAQHSTARHRLRLAFFKLKTAEPAAASARSPSRAREFIVQQLTNLSNCSRPSIASRRAEAPPLSIAIALELDCNLQLWRSLVQPSLPSLTPPTVGHSVSLTSTHCASNSSLQVRFSSFSRISSLFVLISCQFVRSCLCLLAAIDPLRCVIRGARGRNGGKE